MTEQERTKPSWGRVLGEHAAGTTIIASTMAGVAAVASAVRGLPIVTIGNNAALAGIASSLMTVGLGRSIFKAASGMFPSWQSRIDAERSLRDSHHNTR